jgi:HEPN domain-containing protein
MAKSVDKSLYRNYLQKAEEMLDVARYAADKSKNNAAVAASVHCAINAVDALAVFYFGKRHSGGHEEALGAVKGALSEAEFRDLAKQFTGLIALKNQAEYQPDLMKGSQARDALTKASRIISRVRQKLP